MRYLSFLSAAALSTAVTSAAYAHPGHGEPVTGFASLIHHWTSDPAHLAVVIAAAGLGVGLAVVLQRRERAKVRSDR